MSDNLHEGKMSWARTLDLELYSVIASGFFATVSNDFQQITKQKGTRIQDFFTEHGSIFDVKQQQAKL